MKIVALSYVALLGLGAAQFETGTSIPSLHSEQACETALQESASLFGVDRRELALDSGEFTMFHPTKRAIGAFFLWWKKQGKPISPEFLRDIYKYHFLDKTYFSQDLQKGPNILNTKMNSSSYVNLGKGTPQVVNVIKTTGVHPQHAVKVSFGIPRWDMTTASVIKADVPCKGGVIHFIDRVMWFPRYTEATLTDGFAGGMVSAVCASGTNSLLGTTSNVTIFAPVNEALEVVLGKGPVDQDALKDVIETHVARGYHPSTSLEGPLTMFNGKTVDVDVSNGDVLIGGAKVLKANILLRNGIMHVVDKVLTPK